MTEQNRSAARVEISAAEAAERREASVLGNGPRIEPLGVDELTNELVLLIQQMIELNTTLDSRGKAMLTDVVPDAAAGLSSDEFKDKLANLPEIMRTMLRHPHLFARQVDVGIQLLSKGALPAKVRELAILRMAWLCQAPYEWGEHVLIAKKYGLTTEDIERITHGSCAPGWDEQARAVLRAVEELREDATISDATWATLAKYFDERQLIELPILAGQYQAVAYYQNSLRLRLHEGNLGLRAR